jgi:hypothetical protein
MTLLLAGAHGALVVYGRRAGLPVWLLGALTVLVVGTCVLDARIGQRAWDRAAAVDERRATIGEARRVDAA